MKATLTLFMFLAVTATSCNYKTEAEKQKAQRAYTDSIQQAAFAEGKRQAAREAEIAERERVAEAKRLSDKRELVRLLALLDAEMQGEQTRMNSIKSFELLRTSSEKAKQVQNQAMRINAVQMRIDYVKEQLQKLENGVDYEVPGKPTNKL